MNTQNMSMSVSDEPIGFEHYKTRRWMQLWSEYPEILMDEVKESYPTPMLRQEWEAMLDRCAERGMLFTRQLLQSLPIEMQHGINRRSKGASIPARYVIGGAA
jgi:hypothetical protein